jgi:hypothetical protein
VVAQGLAVAEAFERYFDHIRRTRLLIHVIQLSIAQVCWAFERGSGGLLPPPCL